MVLKRVDLPVNGIHLYESKHQDGDIINEHHHGIHQFLFALEGEGAIVLDGVQHECRQDCAVLIVPFSNHAVISDSRLTLLVLAFEEARMDSFARARLLQTCFEASAMLRLNPFAAAEVRQLLRKMLFEQSHEDAYGPWALQIYVHELLLVLARSSQSSAVTDSNSLRADRIRSYIDQHYFEPLTASDLAARLGIGARQVNNIFKEQYRLTPIQYMTEVRIKRAQKLLEETEKDIVSICFEVGYETLPTFYRAFKNIVNVSPNRFRQQSRNVKERGD